MWPCLPFGSLHQLVGKRATILSGLLLDCVERKAEVFNADDTERFLIQLFGRHPLFNCQLGGFYCNYLLKGADDEAFKNLQTDYFWQGLKKTDALS